MPSPERMIASSLSIGVGPVGWWPKEDEPLLLLLPVADTAAVPACMTENIITIRCSDGCQSVLARHNSTDRMVNLLAMLASCITDVISIKLRCAASHATFCICLKSFTTACKVLLRNTTNDRSTCVYRPLLIAFASV